MFCAHHILTAQLKDITDGLSKTFMLESASSGQTIIRAFSRMGMGER